MGQGNPLCATTSSLNLGFGDWGLGLDNWVLNVNLFSSTILNYWYILKGQLT